MAADDSPSPAQWERDGVRVAWKKKFAKNRFAPALGWGIGTDLKLKRERLKSQV
jgi:hypothetical protein